MPTPNRTDSADIVIVGAGPAGSVTAAMLAKRGWDVLLLDRAVFPRDKTCGDGLTPRAVAVLERLGLLAAFPTHKYQIIHSARLVAPDGTDWQMRFGDYDLELPHFGLVVPRYELDDRLRQQAIAQGARFQAGVRVTRLLDEAGRVVGVQSRESGGLVTVRATLTVLATGANIGLLRSAGLLERMPPGMNAIRGYFTGVPDLTDAFEFYFDQKLNPGYAWIFPLADGRANVGLGVPARRGAGGAPNLRQLLAEFMARQPKLQAAQPVGPIRSYPLRTDFPRYRAIGDGFLIVGEALGLVNPVTGEGIDLAMESAELAAEAADKALRQGDVSVGGLVSYERALRSNYASFFRGVRLLLRLATGRRALNLLIRKAGYKPYLAHIMAGINLGTVSPWLAFFPRTWWNILT